ncbi:MULTISPECIES: NHLP leader peptide family RiPP precursor [Nitrospirillum]|uniref:Putative ribosomally synthesized peptide n=1 Tax=Nitrospirillum amazonense TaxID=28077 RepID=A0A560G393_9PROT|nr:NHLP leader peptide family RiPP precursor [Nitrospirillum amazonense]MEC4593962.1 NHLP leader peptide family RiPP precursor [Nitrospirillum amazonense]TWB28302.1 putative ribosomally synthesized peptide [Nitrospirillum amazonense]
MTNEENLKITGKIIAKAWADEGYKARLLANPAAVLTAEGVDLPAGITFRVVEDTAAVQTLVLPARPADLSDDDLDRAAGGLCFPGDPRGGGVFCF